MILQPFDFDPSEKPKHKFMVQALLGQEGDDDEDGAEVVCNITIQELTIYNAYCILCTFLHSTPPLCL